MHSGAVPDGAPSTDASVRYGLPPVGTVVARPEITTHGGGVISFVVPQGEAAVLSLAQVAAAASGAPIPPYEDETVATPPPYGAAMTLPPDLAAKYAVLAPAPDPTAGPSALEDHPPFYIPRL